FGRTSLFVWDFLIWTLGNLEGDTFVVDLNGGRSYILKSNPPSVGPDPPVAARCCPDGWVGYGGKCYYFSEAEGTWNKSQSNCSSSGASLAAIDTPSSPQTFEWYLSEHWIGLRREPGQPWKWTNGTEFNHW
uniref:C-type lectin domain-containing protein n=1 Tax=Terrapene triunguis TaxID=2587831 RepID=A0A674J4S5_9SAUR